MILNKLQTNTSYLLGDGEWGREVTNSSDTWNESMCGEGLR